MDLVQTPVQLRQQGPLLDQYGRLLHYLRLSLTEACNMSCHYCLPKGFPEWYRHKSRLGLPEIEILLKGFRELGFRKVRLTGGEPTLHPQSLAIVEKARSLGYEQVALTTNGVLITDIKHWISAGLTHLNVSFDSLDPEVFYQVTRSHDGPKVRALVEKAAETSLSVKVNTVLVRSMNGSPNNIRSLIEWALNQPITLRFIELMDTQLNRTFASAERVNGHEVTPFINERNLEQIQYLDSSPYFLRGPSVDYGSAEYPGRIGLINPLSCNFCSSCNRLRVTAKGRLKICLFGNEDLALDLRSPESVAESVRQHVAHKEERHHLEKGWVGNVATFRTIGG